MKNTQVLGSNDPFTEIITAVARHPNLEDFCKYLSFAGINEGNLAGACLVTLSANTQLSYLGGFLPQTFKSVLNELMSEIFLAISQRDTSRICAPDTLTSVEADMCIALIPSILKPSATGVLILFFQGPEKNYVLDAKTQLALAFACEMYSSKPENQDQHEYPSDSAPTLLTVATELTPRQIQILALMATGSTNESIARSIKYSLATVKGDVSHILKFLGVIDRKSAVSEASLRSLLTPSTKTDLLLRTSRYKSAP